MTKRARMTHDSWHNTHDKRWPPTLISKTAQDHPAKFAYALIHRIYQHVMREHWCNVGDIVLDPFGGVALGALFATTRGLDWFGVELEQDFVDAGYANIALWDKTFSGALPHYGRATLVSGDSRELIHHLLSDESPHAAKLAVSSPPFLAQSGGTNVTAKSGPLSDAATLRRARAGNSSAKAYGATKGQMANMPTGVLKTVISSPPYLQSIKRKGDTVKNIAKRMRSKGWSERAIKKAATNSSNDVQSGYGSTPGQLESLPPGKVGAVISSPPFSTSNPPRGGKHGRGSYDQTKGLGLERQKDDYHTYDSEGNLASITGDTYWGAALSIVSQCYDALPSGAHAVWVCKDYIRRGERVDFSGDWRKLCERVGFVTLHRHDAVLTENHGTQLGGIAEQANKRRSTSHKSMFKRILEDSGKIPPVNEEIVWCMLRP